MSEEIITINIIYKAIFEEVLKLLEEEDYDTIKKMTEVIIMALDDGIRMMSDLNEMRKLREKGN